MTDVFISYSSKDSLIAKNLKNVLEKINVDAFMSELSIEPGKKWKDEIISKMSDAKWVIFLMSKNAKASMAVAHEVGAALFGKKDFYVVIWDMGPEEMPDWIQDVQVINLGKGEQHKLDQLIDDLGKKVQLQKWVIVGLLAALFAFFVLGSKK